MKQQELKVEIIRAKRVSTYTRAHREQEKYLNGKICKANSSEFIHLTQRDLTCIGIGNRVFCRSFAFLPAQDIFARKLKLRTEMVCYTPKKKHT